MENRDNEKVYLYKIYGLTVKSDMEFSEAIEIDEDVNIDVTINIGKIPSHINRYIEEGRISNYTIDETWFYIKNVGKYYIHSGNTIVVEPMLNSSTMSLKAYILGSSLGFLMIQRNIIAIHGGSININGKSIIITGDSGAGKSTLTTFLREEGYGFISDDISSLSVSYYKLNDKNTCNVTVQPAYPQQKLCRDTMLNFNYSLSKYRMVDEDREKFIIPLRESFVNKPIALRAIVELQTYDGDDVVINEVIGAEKIKIFMKNIYRSWVFEYYNIPKEYFKLCLDTIKNISVYIIKRPRDKFTVEYQKDKILEIMNS